MVHKLIEWAVGNPLVVILLALALAAVGAHAFLNVNVEAYPDPAPAIIEVVAQYPGASAEEVERRVTIPLELALAGMPGLKYTRSKSLAGLAHLRNQFDYGIDFYKARQEVINRLQNVQDLPAGVNPQISPESPTGEIYRYTLRSPKDALGRDIYTQNDLKALQDWTLEREFRRLAGIADVASTGGSVKRYEIHPDPNLLKKHGITLQQLQDAVSKSNGNVGGDILKQGRIVYNVRGIGLIGGGLDPVQHVLGLEQKEFETWLARQPEMSAADKSRLRAAFTGETVQPPLSLTEKRRVRDLHDELGPKAAVKAAKILREEEQRRLREIRDIIIVSVNGIPIRVDDLVEGGPISDDAPSTRGVVVGSQTRLGRITLTVPRRLPNPEAETPDPWYKAVLRRIGILSPSEPVIDVRDKNGEREWLTELDTVQGIVLLRKNEESLPALRLVEAKVKELNETPGRLLPGVQVEPYYDRTELIGVTTETVQENLLLGMGLVSMILLMFLSNVRSAVIVAINIPLALLFAFAVLYLRGKSANLLSIGAVDFGIIVDSTVIMVENIYRHVSSGEHRELPLRERIIRASGEVERSLFFSTIIMVCALLPLFTMQGPEGQIFGPMADTYAFALGGALLLALTLSPVLCLLFYRRLKPARDNFLVRWLKVGYLWQLERSLNYRGVALAVVGFIVAFTAVVAVPNLGQEFMPQLEEGNLYIRGTFSLNASLEEVTSKITGASGGKNGKPIVAPAADSRPIEERVLDALSVIRKFDEVEAAVAQIGRPDDGTDPTGFYNVEIFVPLRPEKQWPRVKDQGGWWSHVSAKRSRTKDELIEEMNGELNRVLIGIDWNFSQNIRDNVMESLSGVKGDNSVKIFGPDLDRLEQTAEEVKNALERIQGIENVGVFHIQGQSNVELGIDRAKCKRFGVSVADLQNVIETAIKGKAFSSMVEGEKTFDVTVRLAEKRRGSVNDILDIPVDVTNNAIVPGAAGLGVSPSGTSQPPPVAAGTATNATYNTNITNSLRQPLGSLVSPIGKDGALDPKSTEYVRPGASTISREQGQRLIAVKFSVRNRDLGSAVAEAQQAIKLEAPYRAEWSGEFQEMEEAVARLVKIVALSLVLILILLYLAFGSLLDAFTIFANVVAMSVGGVWALVLTGLNFNISAAVGFISILGVAIMNGLLMVSSFNRLRAHGMPLRTAILEGVGHLVRPVTMTALAAIFGLLPAALSTRIGSQSQRPLAIVVVGGMIMTLFLMNLVPLLYSFYGQREPSEQAGRMAH
jgi:cobalt-zinc-cadmium resistance protein CzcA